MSALTRSRFLVTGAQGFVGRYVIQSLLGIEGCHLLGMGRSQALRGSFTHRLASGVRAPLPQELVAAEVAEHYSYLQCDLADVETLAAALAKFQPTHVIHLSLIHI